ncbi:MAG: Activator of Hsp90 ATPase 1 family protein [Bacteroidetes bacterium]|nr:MAG: Activator of Hsp90 ATPase 1 family protein [Bacteroidota bacterium]
MSEKEKSAKPFVIERIYNAPVEKVWKAISDKDEMKQWYFDLPDFRAEPGCEFRFTGGPEPDRQYLHVCKVTEVIPGKKLSYTWRYEGYEGDSLVTFELFADGNKTRLVLTHEGLHTFPASNPDFAKGNFVTGWTHIVNIGLQKFLDKD